MNLPSLNVSIEPTTAEQMRVINELMGLVFLEGDTFCIEYTVESLMSAVMGKFGGAGKVHRYELPLNKLSDVVYKKKLIGARLTVRPSRLSVLDGMHGIENNCLRLNIKRADRELAQQYASRINLRISELQLEQFDDSTRERLDGWDELNGRGQISDGDAQDPDDKKT